MSKKVIANIADMDVKTKHLPEMLSNLGDNQGRSPRIIL